MFLSCGLLGCESFSYMLCRLTYLCDGQLAIDVVLGEGHEDALELLQVLLHLIEIYLQARGGEDVATVYACLRERTMVC